MKIIGHRGAKGLAPENTLASFKKALEHKVDEIECDVRLTKDNIPVMLHDAEMHVPSGKEVKVYNHTLAELRELNPNLATLEECVRYIDRKVPMYIEVKPGMDAKPIADCIKQFLKSGWKAEDFLFGSFDYKVLRALKNELPQIRLIVIENWSGIRATYRARRLETKFVSMNQQWLWSGYIKAVKRNGYHLYSYTLNDAKKARNWSHYGLYAAVTDYPDLYSGK